MIRCHSHPELHHSDSPGMLQPIYTTDTQPYNQLLSILIYKILIKHKMKQILGLIYLQMHTIERAKNMTCLLGSLDLSADKNAIAMK